MKIITGLCAALFISGCGDNGLSPVSDGGNDSGGDLAVNRVDANHSTDLTLTIDSNTPTDLTLPIDSNIPTDLTLPIDSNIPIDLALDLHVPADLNAPDQSAPDLVAAVDGALPTTVPDPCRGTLLPGTQNYVAPGLCARLVGQTQGGLRQITFAPDGDLFGVTAAGSVLRFHDTDNDGIYGSGEITTWATTGGNGNNCHVDAAGGFIYAGTPTGVSRWPWAPGSASGGAGEIVVSGQPSTGNHPKHTVHVYDGYLYVHSGSSDNMSDPMSPAYDTGRALVRRFALGAFVSGTPFDWSSGEIYSSGIRNMVGFTRNAAGQLFGVNNGMDNVRYQSQDVHQNNPGDDVLALGPGKTFGYPFCYTAGFIPVNNQVILAGTQVFNQDFPTGYDDAWCAANADKPATFLQAHSAPLDIHFFETEPAGALPEAFRGGAFISSHGSWDRNTSTGYKVVWMPFDSNGVPPMPTAAVTGTTYPYTTIFGGGTSAAPVDGAWSWSNGAAGESTRPVGVAISPIDGALYISSDASSMLYRVGLIQQ